MNSEEPKRILIVDDDPGVCKLLGLRLKREGFTVSSAFSGKQGVEIAINQGADLIIMDIMMPDMDGSEASQILKENKQTKNIPILYLTALEKKEEESQFDDIHMDQRVFAKPCNIELLLKYIRKILKIQH